MRERDEVWDALVEECGANSARMTPSERGRYNKAVKDLKAANATAEEVHRVARVYRNKFPGIHVTPNGLAVHFSACLAANPPARPPTVREPEPEVTPEQRRENIARLNALIAQQMEAHGVNDEPG